MAATATVVAQLNSSSAGAQTATTASFTPTANSKLVVVALASNNNHTAAKVWTISGGSLSWTDGALGGPWESGAGANFDVEVDIEWADVGSSPSSMTVAVDAYSGTDTAWYGITVYEVLGSQPGVFGSLQTIDFDNVADPSTPTLALGAGKTANSVLLCSIFAVSDGAIPTWAAAPAGWTRATQPGGTDGINVSAMTSTTDDPPSVSAYGTTNNTLNHYGALIEIGEAPALLGQSAYRFGLDDGTESGHTFPVAENTPITVATATRRLLRMQIDNSTGADVTTAYRLQYKRTDEADTEWRDI